MQNDSITGLCRCGCGQVPPPCWRTNRAIGWIKGQPRPTVPGHFPKHPENAIRSRSPEMRAKISAAKRGKPRPDLVARNREMQRNVWAMASQEQRLAIVERLAAGRVKAGPRDTASRAKTGASTRRWWASLPESASADHKARIRVQNLGNRFSHSAAAKQRISAAKRVYWASLPADEKQRRRKREIPRLLAMRLAMLPDVRPTAIERMVRTVLDSLGMAYEQHKPIGPYVADFYLPDGEIDLECDGDYWHSLQQVQARDRRRDGWFKWKGFSVVRLKERDIRSDAMTCVKAALGM